MLDPDPEDPPNRDFIPRRHYRLVLSSAPTPPFTESSSLTSLHTEHARIAAVAKLCFHRSSSPSCTAAQLQYPTAAYPAIVRAQA
jgi:hypothetical protein